MKIIQAHIDGSVTVWSVWDRKFVRVSRDVANKILRQNFNIKQAQKRKEIATCASR